MFITAFTRAAVNRDRSRDSPCVICGKRSGNESGHFLGTSNVIYQLSLHKSFVFIRPQSTIKRSPENKLDLHAQPVVSSNSVVHNSDTFLKEASQLHGPAVRCLSHQDSYRKRI